MKYTFDIKTEDLNMFQLKELVIFLIKLLAENQKIDEKQIPESIKKHFKKV